ncbi:MAG: HDOD domain-containing protein [Thermodesulfobacteriota bacterium]
MGEGQKERNRELDLDQQIGFLRRLHFFADFDDHELKQFLAVSKWLRVPKGALVVRQGTMERAFYILVKGEAQVVKAGRGRKPVVLTTLAPGECIGEMAMVTELRRTADVVASQDAFVLRMEPEVVSTASVFLQLKFYKRFSEILVSRLDLANRRMAGEEEVAATPAPDVAEKPTPAVLGAVPAAPAETAAKPGATIMRQPLPPMPSPKNRLAPSKLQPKIKAEHIRCINPAVIREVGRMLRDGEATDNTRAFAEAIGLDPVLACKVVQAANSPLYRRATAVSSVPHAMVIIGMRNIRREVERFITASRDVVPFSGYEGVARSFWRHSLAVARIAELLKEALRVEVGLDIMLAGLLHDLGVLALDLVAPDFYPQLAGPEPPFAELIRAEKEYIGMDHGKAGAWLGEQLGLPQPYLDVMHYHHAPQRAPLNRLAVALVALANIFAAESGEAFGGQAKPVGEEVMHSTAWDIIRQEHAPFRAAHVPSFVGEFRWELERSLSDVVGRLPQ